MTVCYRYIGSAHPFYKHGETYSLFTWRTIFGRTRIEVHRGKDSVIGASQKSYHNHAAFLKEWVPEVRG